MSTSSKHDSCLTHHQCMTVWLISAWHLRNSYLTRLCQLLPDSHMQTHIWLAYLWPLSDPPFHDSNLPYMCVTHIRPGCAWLMSYGTGTHLFRTPYIITLARLLSDSNLHVCYLANLYIIRAWLSYAWRQPDSHVHDSCLTRVCMTSDWLTSTWLLSKLYACLFSD